MDPTVSLSGVSIRSTGWGRSTRSRPSASGLQLCSTVLDVLSTELPSPRELMPGGALGPRLPLVRGLPLRGRAGVLHVLASPGRGRIHPERLLRLNTTPAEGRLRAPGPTATTRRSLCATRASREIGAPSRRWRSPLRFRLSIERPIGSSEKRFGGFNLWSHVSMPLAKSGAPASTTSLRCQLPRQARQLAVPVILLRPRLSRLWRLDITVTQRVLLRPGAGDELAHLPLPAFDPAGFVSSTSPRSRCGSRWPASSCSAFTG